MGEKNGSNSKGRKGIIVAKPATNSTSAAGDRGTTAPATTGGPIVTIAQPIEFPVGNNGRENNNDGIANHVSGGNAPIDAGGSNPAGIIGGNGDGRSGDNREIPNPTTGRTPGKPGRHKGDCGCDKCVARRERQGKGFASPFDVRLDGTGAIPKETGKVLDFLSNASLIDERFRKSVELVWQGIYQMPILMGYGAYWALQAEEGKQLTDQTVNLLNNIPLKHRKQIMDAMQTWLPLSSFMVTVGMITYPRYIMAQMEMQQRKGNTNGGNQSANSASKAGGENSNDSSKTTPQREHPFAGLVHA